MKKIKIAHWIFTGLLSVLLVMGASMYIFEHETVVGNFAKLGFPEWLIYPMATAKLLAVLMLLTKFNKSLTEWAYAGIFLNLLLAVSAHVAVSDGEFPAALIGLILVLASYFTWGKSQKA
ncbi:MAG: hypothetical protein ACJA1C_000570 [Crocinitomicaceae bacterium]|jgi:hypothetical protein